MALPIHATLQDGTAVELDHMRPPEAEIVRSLLNGIVAEGTSYPQKVPLSASEFAAYWLKGQAYVVRPALFSPASAPASGSNPPMVEVLGAFYIKPNFPGRCGHICNAGFIVDPRVRGQGLGHLMGKAMLKLARELGYRGVMYNLVFETNLPSLKIWHTLGFQEIGRIPQAAYLPDDRYVDAIMLYKSLVD
jgi:L-amino acid N-acyltransferase YncA